MKFISRTALLPTWPLIPNRRVSWQSCQLLHIPYNWMNTLSSWNAAMMQQNLISSELNFLLWAPQSIWNAFVIGFPSAIRMLIVASLHLFSEFVILKGIHSIPRKSPFVNASMLLTDLSQFHWYQANARWVKMRLRQHIYFQTPGIRLYLYVIWSMHAVYTYNIWSICNIRYMKA